jgi:hypothetical protein
MRANVSWKQALGACAVLLAIATTYAFGRVETLRRQETWTYARVPHTLATSLERRLGDAASSIAGRPVQVRCQDVSDGTAIEPGGVVEFNGGRPADFAQIRPDECGALARFIRSPAGAAVCLTQQVCSPTVLQSTDALNVLAHESVHLSGIRNEAMTECAALHELPRLAHELGANQSDSHAFAALEYTFAYPHLPPNYRLPGCRP